MFSPLANAASEALDQALDRLRISLLAAAATSRETLASPTASPLEARCHSTGASTRDHRPRGTDTAA